MHKLFIPKRLKVGFQERPGTYTGKLAYIIYYDENGKLRKEKSWRSWCTLEDIKLYKRENGKRIVDGIEKAIEPQEFDNVPTEGFVLNKRVGGYSTGWNHRNTYCRVYDPRGFEFEISIENLLFILTQGTCHPGKGLEGEFVYSWDGKDLVLLPCSSEEYKSSQEWTKVQQSSFSIKDLNKGYTYLTKKQEEAVYLGRFKYHFIYNDDGYGPNKNSEKGFERTHVFWNLKKEKFEFINSSSGLSGQVSDSTIDNYAELVELYYNMPYGSKATELFLKNDTYKRYNTEYWSFAKGNEYYICETSNENNYYRSKIVLDNIIKECYHSARMDKNVDGPKQIVSHNTPYYYYKQSYMFDKYVEPTGKYLWARLESGKEYPFYKLKRNRVSND